MQPDSLGYVWAALTTLVRADSSIQQGSSGVPSRAPSARQTARPAELRDYVPSDQVMFGSSPSDRPASSGSNDTHSSIGYVEGLTAPLVEDATVRLASCFIRCVLNYGQHPSQDGPLLYFRDERQTLSFAGKPRLHAIDDGGIQDIRNGQRRQVAMLEAKRTFTKVVDGNPVVTDQLLAQLVGEAMAMRCSQVRTVDNTNIITILAASHFIKFFHFQVSEDFFRGYTQGLQNADNYLHVHSTLWFDLRNAKHRERVVAHIFALMAWANG